MPELPDVTIYVESLAARVIGQPLEHLTIKTPFVLRSVSPPISAAQGRRVSGVRRLGKRIVLDMGDEMFVVIHLMIAGRLRWRAPGAKMPAGNLLATFHFPTGVLALTEAGSTRRASLHIVQGEAALREMDRGGIEPLEIDLATFAEQLGRENHTLKRSLTDPRIFSGIGNAYSDEILHRARLSPLALSRKLSPEEVSRLYEAVQVVLREWTDRLRAQLGGEFPEKVTAFRDEMSVHGRYGKPCPVCGTTVQRIRYASNETNYCARCQTGGRLLADRAMSRLLREDWPKSIDELE
ncbi:MAG TPA: DNA-formamidopyrimidine glycosylase family protein [Gemmatimonadaceae bacterium]|jgi:formamidopyrimidine-DNA glycosylase|nr:DNA-formamidopyrimidine glycosylase family protein [Gemmatimonadaceae bacterium]